MRRFKIFFIKMSFLGLTFQGCGTEVNKTLKTKKTYPIAIGTAVSITDKDIKDESLTQELSKIMVTHLNDINRLEATNFSKNLNYCQVTGLKDENTLGTLEKIIRKIEYKSCQNDNNIQNGDIIMKYDNIDEDGKFPHHLELEASNDYNFNNITLKEGATIECQNINYKEDKSIDSMIVIINGTVEYNSEVYELENHQEVIRF